MTKVTKRAEKANDLLRGAKVERSGLKAQVAHSPGRRLKNTCWPSVRLAMVHPTTRLYAAENRLQASPVFNIYSAASGGSHANTPFSQVFVIV